MRHRKSIGKVIFCFSLCGNYHMIERTHIKRCLCQYINRRPSFHDYEFRLGNSASCQTSATSSSVQNQKASSVAQCSEPNHPTFNSVFQPSAQRDFFSCKECMSQIVASCDGTFSAFTSREREARLWILLEMEPNELGSNPAKHGWLPYNHQRFIQTLSSPNKCYEESWTHLFSVGNGGRQVFTLCISVDGL